ncbi:recombinase family protein [Tenacibaculum singaporense]|uniref:Recombinase family protein n=1 Tax=Tenacibaculum singaporense TaxID=2358479 RepID=A0A3S8R9D2_9FLAO|nr:recombinase family protein [Tenacibaculum singaporense]AZJ36382.1 recombinase family protein [Tenacibaculum singaporense]
MLGIYCRTSKNRKDKYTIDDQRDGGINCAKELGLKYRMYVDDGISGTLDESVRDGLSDLFRDIRKEEITHVYCIDQSRIERNSRTWDFFVAECLNKKIKYYPGGSFFDLDNPTNKMLASLMSVVNAYYAEITSKKVRLANARKAKEGKTHGIKPYGYKKSSNNDYVVDEEEAVHVRRMFQLSLEGKGAYTIANIFNDEGIPTKYSRNFKGEITRKDSYTGITTIHDKSSIKWRGNVISDILRNKIYKGIREWNRYEDNIENVNGKSVKSKVKAELIISQVPNIVEPELWEKVQDNLALNKKNVGKKEKYRYLLNGLIYCKHCGSEFRGKKRLKGNDNAYKCKGVRKPNKICEKSRGINLPKLETFIIKHLFDSKELKNILVNIPSKESKNDKLKKELLNHREKEKQINKRIKRAYKLLLEDDFRSDDTIKNDLITSKKKLINIRENIGLIEQKIHENENNSRAKRAKSIIELFTLENDFESIKLAIHRMVDKIIISHERENKTGNYKIEIHYKDYDEYSVFLTDYKAIIWDWTVLFRTAAFNKEQLKEDYETLDGLFDLFSIEDKDIKKLIEEVKKTDILYEDAKEDILESITGEFQGFKQLIFMNSKIELNKNELINFETLP